MTRISIHAPTRGATEFGHREADLVKISIHAPTRGATESFMSISTATLNFNPRSHEGSDEYDGQPFIEIEDFNPRSHEGSDKYRSALVAVSFLFQSTLPRGERHFYGIMFTVITAYFNPRSHEGSDKRRGFLFLFLIISIHAPTRGATFIQV